MKKFTIRTRYLVMFVIFLLLAATASNARTHDGHPNYVGAILLAIGAFVSLGVGIWEEAERSGDGWRFGDPEDKDDAD